MSDEQALATLKPATQLQSHRVSQIVNNSRNKSEECNKPIEMVKTKKPTMNKMMSAWLNVRKRKEVALAQSGSDLHELKNYHSGETVSTSESESESTAVKRPRFSEFKQDIKNLPNLENYKVETDDEHDIKCKRD